MASTPEPAYQLLKQTETFALREYPAQLAADVTLTGQDASQNNAFRILAAYIFKEYPSGKIGMTAPVTTATQKIGMTAPVTTASNGNASFMRFYMPARYTSATLPKPEDSRIAIVEIPARKVAVVSFSGWWNQTKALQHESELRSWIEAQKLIVTGPPEYQQFNSPWTLPWWRRNEVWLPVK